MLSSLLAAATRHDFLSFAEKTFTTVNPGRAFVPGWHVEAMAEYLAACETGEVKRLIINLPPRHLKSVLVSVAWPAWLLGWKPERRVICASYAERLALKHSLDSRMTLESNWFARAFPETRLMKPAAGEKLRTTRQGFRLATSVGASLIGEGGDVLIVDDPLNPRQAESAAYRAACADWFQQGFLTRLDDKGTGAVVLVMQRLHGEDLTGFLLSHQPGVWEHLKLPAIAEADTWVRFRGFEFLHGAGEALHPAREPIAVLERLRRELGAYVFSAQYQQEPMPREGGMLKAAWFPRFRAAPAEMERIVQSWDTAAKTGGQNDYSACVTLGVFQGRYYVIDVWQGRVEYPELKRMVASQALRFKPAAILVEDKASGQSLLQDLRAGGLPLIGICPRGGKEARLFSVAGLCESGRVWLPEEAPWLAAFESELFAFPSAAHDDQVDALTQALIWGRERGGVTVRGL